jgi:GT2 family glycosyltransferase
LLADCIAPAVEGIVAKARASNPVSPEERQFGVAPRKPLASVVVPLYGRYDFLRHQIAHFVDDADFHDIDLIYVLDDPTIEYETLITAARVYALFGLPFRVVSYGRNLGFGGANNIGAQCATSQTLVLLNSDILPIAPGWVSGLAKALKTLPSAKAVAPLLLFGDGMVQHAGMTSGPSPDIDGLLLNHHPGKGLPWAGGDTARKVDLLTAACIVTRTEHYRKAGGFDESFVIGDYEDSDLCRRLVGKDGLLYLVPEFRLWHLERQSQTVGAGANQRMLITIMNGMRYSNRQAVPKGK